MPAKTDTPQDGKRILPAAAFNFIIMESSQ